MSPEGTLGFANEESQGLTMLSLGSELPTDSSLQLYSCCYGRSHSGAFAGSMLSGGWAGGSREQGKALVSLVRESE